MVYLGSYNDSEVAIKQTNLSVGQNALDDFKREAVLLLSIKPHPSIVQVLGISVNGENIYMVMEFCEHGSFDVYARDHNVDDAAKEKILDSISSGIGAIEPKNSQLSPLTCLIAHLHRSGIIHRDLAARNILLGAGLKAKVADFGMSRIVDKFEQKGQTTANIGPIKYMAPVRVNEPRSSAFAK